MAISCKIVQIEKFIKLVLPPLPKSVDDTLFKTMEQRVSKYDLVVFNPQIKGMIKNFLYQESQGICPVCGRRINSITLDHIVAKSLGGKNILSNYIGMCEDCNTEKDNKTVLEFLCSKELNSMPYRILKEAYKQQQELKIRLNNLKDELNEIV